VTKPFSFGVNVRTAASARDWAQKARRVEELGYSTLTVPDHLAEMLAPMLAALGAAAATTRLRVGTNVLNNDLRHPVLVARETATADVLTGGRFQLGLGAGHMKSEYDAAGLTFERGATRVARLAEAVTIIKKLLRGERLTFAGRYYRVTDHALYPKPVQLPHPPILIGGNGPRLLDLAAREADIVGLTGITFAAGGTQPDLSAWRSRAVDERIALLRTAAGARFQQLVLEALVQRVVITKPSVDERRAAAAELTRGQLTPDEALESPFALLGCLEQIEELLQARRERWGISSYTVFEPAVELLAPVVARLSGR
jgi:probable F420-dependent oxidoreductase